MRITRFSSSRQRPLYQRTAAAHSLPARLPMKSAPRFQGNKTSVKLTEKFPLNLFNHSAKNTGWGAGYSMAGLLLLPAPPVATTLFILAALHFGLGAYQFLANRKNQTGQ